MRGAIIIPVFQRTFSLNRLLNSLSSSDINENLFIVFSLDKFYNQEVLEIINDYKWHFGKKIIVCNNYKRGVDGNNLNCFFLGIDYDYFILLEDDCIVHPAFHQYIKDSLNFYSYNNHGISGFSLYRFERDELSLTPHRVPNNCNFTFFMQKASSRGSFYTKNQIQKFLQFLELRILAIDIPKQVQRWGNDNWEVIFMKYLVYSNQYMVYPRLSLSVPFCEIGVHFKRKSDLYSYISEMLWVYDGKKIHFEPFEGSLLKYNTNFKITLDWFKFYNSNAHEISIDNPLIPFEINAIYSNLIYTKPSNRFTKFISKERKRFLQITYRISYKELMALFMIKIIEFARSKLPH